MTSSKSKGRRQKAKDGAKFCFAFCLLPFDFCLVYCSFNTAAGSRRAARRAGISTPSPAARSSTPAAVPKEIGSRELTPASARPNACVPKNARPRPTTSPMAMGRWSSRSTPQARLWRLKRRPPAGGRRATNIWCRRLRTREPAWKQPCFPSSWPLARMDYRAAADTYHVCEVLPASVPDTFARGSRLEQPDPLRYRPADHRAAISEAASGTRAPALDAFRSCRRRHRIRVYSCLALESPQSGLTSHAPSPTLRAPRLEPHASSPTPYAPSLTPQ